MAKKSALDKQLKKMLANPEKHGPMLDALLEVVKSNGNKGLKKHIQQWIDEIKRKEGVE
jgi:hypothetical protein